MILAIRTDRPEAELYLLKNDSTVLDQFTWLANRELSDTLITEIEDLLTKNSKMLSDVSEIRVFKGPGSFTGLRIGITVANTLAYVLAVPVVGGEGKDWLLGSQDNSTVHKKFGNVVIPYYGSEANITAPRK